MTAASWGLLSRWGRVVYHGLKPSSVGARCRSAILRRRFRRCGNGLRLPFDTVVTGHRNIVVGDNFVSMGRLYMYAHDGYLEIGDNTDTNTNVQLGAAGGRLIIGNHVTIAPNVVIRAANHGIDRRSTIKSQPSIGGEIVIEDDVWIGANAVITSDVRLAKGTVVGAGAVVTRSTSPYSIVAGVPAKQIGQRK